MNEADAKNLYALSLAEQNLAKAINEIKALMDELGDASTMTVTRLSNAYSALSLVTVQLQCLRKEIKA